MGDDTDRTELSRNRLLYAGVALLITIVVWAVWPVTTYQIPRMGAVKPASLEGTPSDIIIDSPDFNCHPSIRDAEKKFVQIKQQFPSASNQSERAAEVAYHLSDLASPTHSATFWYRYANVVGTLRVRGRDDIANIAAGARMVDSLVDELTSDQTLTVNRPRIAYYWDRKVAPEIKQARKMKLRDLF